jgi:3-hydroxyacyl-CoA dehydrogenase/enoyl-CoA hydratase/3-hydroxybutyryl-CoA epimerase
MAQKQNFKHWKLDTDAQDILWLHADKAGESTNSLSQDMLEELNSILDIIESERPRGVVFLSDKANGFIAGADIKQLAQADNLEQARAFIRLGQSICNRVERLRMPTVCLIHGFCLGGGLELALACRYRVADNDASTKLGLPEVKLGIHPGFGGTMRLPLLIGAPAAMDLMLTGRMVSARAAKKIGIVDYAVPDRQLRFAAQSIINNPPKPHKLSGWKALTNKEPVRRLLANYLRKQVAKKAAPNHYPAPYALIDLWEKHGNNRHKMLTGEEQSVSRLVVGKTARNLIRVFFLQEGLKDCGDKSLFTPTRVHVIGGGVMGGDIAAWCALQGMAVTLQDRHEENIARVIKNANKLYQKKLKHPLLVTAALDRLIPDMDGLGLPHADVVIEAIFEDKEAKQSLFKEIEDKLKPEAVLASNTSSIPLEQLGEVLNDPTRLVGIHFFNPVAMMQLVEIVNGSNTNPEVAKKAAAFTRHINRLPLPVKSTPGFLVNRVLMPYLVEAVMLESEGIAPAVIDQAALDFGMPMGPIALGDTVGLDICLSVAGILSQSLSLEVPQRLRTLVEAGRLGRKSGHGFYRYKDGKPQDNQMKKSDYQPEDVQDRLMLRMLNEAVACLREGVVDGADLLDAGIIFGTGFAPFRGGPLHYRDNRGLNSLYKRLIKLEERYGSRFTPDAGWQQALDAVAAAQDNSANIDNNHN